MTLDEMAGVTLKHQLRTNKDVDAACTLIRQVVKSLGCAGIEVFVRGDGRVSFRALDRHHFLVQQAEADLLPGSALSTPSEALHKLATFGK